MRAETVRKILGTAEQVIGKLVAKSDGNPELLRLQGSMLYEFAQTYATQGDTAKADETARKAFTIAERLAKAEPGNAARQRDLAVAHLWVGNVLATQGGHHAEALQSYRDGLAIIDRMAKAKPGNTDWDSDLMVAYNKVGAALMAQGDLAEALNSYRDGLAIADRLAKAEHPAITADRATSPSAKRGSATS